MSGNQNQKQNQKQKKKRAATNAARQVVASIVSASAPKLKKRQNRKRNQGGMSNLGNQGGSTGRLGLSSVNRSSGRMGQVIEEDEYIADINGSVGFVTTTYNVNPGQQGTFPWQYRIAALFEKYHFTMLEFYYRREVSEYATNGQSGKVMLSFDYDASDAPPTSKQQVLDTIPHIDAMPCEPEIRLKINCAQFNRQDGWYVRPGAQPANTDIKTYDCGLLAVSTYGNQNTTAIGELRVRYRCQLSVPVLESVGGAPNQPGSFLQLTSALAGETSAATTVYAPLFASTTTPTTIANSIGATIASTGLITLQAGVYLITCQNSSNDSAVSVTGGTLELNQVVTANTQAILTVTGAVNSANNAGGHAGWSSSGSIIWPTAQYGTTVCLQVANTYASGTCFNNGLITITTL